MSKVIRIERLSKHIGQVETITPSETVAEAAKRMHDSRIGSLIVKEANEIVGILSERDIVAKVVAKLADTSAVEVRDIMTEHVVSCRMSTPLGEAQQIMAAHNIRHLPIIEEGAPIGMVSSRDIFAHQLREANVELAEVSKKAEVATEAKNHLLSNVSHEIRTPMNGIIGMTELAMDTTLTPDQRDCLNIIKHSAESLLGMLNDMLNLSQMEVGKTEFREMDFDLRSTIGTMMHALGMRAEAKGLNLTCKVMSDVPDRLVGDPAQLCQVLVNLTSNAIKFAESGQIDVRVETDHWFERDVILHFSVADSGIGIPKEKQEVIFEAFRHAEEPYRRKHEGLGLGLAISAKIVERMGGKIWLESEEGQGSTFHFTVRLQLQKRRPGWEYQNKISPSGEGTTKKPANKPRQTKTQK